MLRIFIWVNHQRRTIILNNLNLYSEWNEKNKVNTISYIMNFNIITAVVLFVSLLKPLNSFAQNLTIASWNIAWLGSHKYNQRSTTDYQSLAVYAKLLNADVIALQEVEDAYWAKKVFGEHYDYYFSSRESTQRVGVAIKKSAQVTVLVDEYKALDVKGVRYGLTVNLTRNGKQLTLLALHLKSGFFEYSLAKFNINAMPMGSSKAKKKKLACALLASQKKVLEQWQQHQSNKNGAYIMLGDFNRRFAKEITSAKTPQQSLWQGLNDNTNGTLWAPTTSLNSKCWGGYFTDYIDHIVFNNIAKRLYREGSFKQWLYQEKYSRKRTRLLSDHCPISVTLNF
jgi:endonuclease/exonuclease/phosphatase family metal-dependent hydrolase